MNVKLADFDSCLTFDTFERTDSKVSLWVWHRDPTRLRGMAVLVVTALDGDFDPTARFEFPDNIFALHTHGCTHKER